MRKLVVPVLLIVLSLGAEVASALATVTEPQAPVQIAPPLSAMPAQPAKAGWLTPEIEATLLEARKILREARGVAETIQNPAPILGDRHRRKALERRKDELLHAIEEAQLQAGDVAIMPTAEGRIGFKQSLALAQARYGFTKEAVQTVSSETLTGDSLLLLVETLVKSGDIPAAIRLAEIQLPKDGVELWRHKIATAIFSYIAEEQHKAGDVKARETLNRAIKEKPSPTFAHTAEYIHALLYLGRAQAALGDKVASAETFKQAIDALSIKRKDRNPSEQLKWIAKAQAEAGDAAASRQTFQQAIRERRGYGDLTCLAWAQDVTGDHQAAAQSLKLAIEDAERLPLEEQKKGIRYIVRWQIKLNDREAAMATMEQLRKMGDLVDTKVIALRFGFLDTAMAIDAETPKTDEEKASWLRLFAQRLIETGSSLGTPEKLKQLSQEATLLRNRLPKDRSKSEWMLAHIAVVQAAAGDLTNSRETIEHMADGPQLSFAYEWIVDVFIHKGDLAMATQIASEMNEERRPFTTMLRNLGSAYGKSEEVAAGVAWSRQQQNFYARTEALFGVAEGIMKAQGIKAMYRSDIDRLNRCPDLVDYQENRT